MRGIVISLFIILINFGTFSQVEENRIQKAINNFAKSDGLENAAITFMAYDLDSNVVLAQLNERLSISPASTTKLFTTAAAFEILGKDFQPKTAFYITGDIDTSGVLQGDLIIRSLGDASLGSLYFYEEEEQHQFLRDWLNLISQKGIKSINGQIIVDGSAFGYNGVPNGWAWSDMGNYYGAGPSASALYDNMTKLHFSTSNRVGGPTSLDSLTPNIPGYKLDNRVTTYNKNSDNAYIYGSPFSYDRFAIGNLPINRSNFEVKASIPDPELLLAQTIHYSLDTFGITTSSPATGRRIIEQNDDFRINYSEITHLFDYKGKTIEEIAFWTNMRSVNFFAEQLLSLIGYQTMGNGETTTSSNYLNQYWKNRLGVSMFQRDGSGLSRSNGFSANHFIQLLTYMYQSDNFKVFESTFPIAGKSGTLTSLGRGQAIQGRLKAKSGTMNKIKSYAGYVDANNGHKIAFSITVNNYDLSHYQLVRKMEQVFNTLVY
ncbi:MAG: D-alanyl-D-alanine carboxypeptidase/D-alanyl-D-alanine-endopeptidase [Brumimicrobium sp.]